MCLRIVWGNSNVKRDSQVPAIIGNVNFHALVCQHEPQVRALALALLGSISIADEVCLRVFVRAYGCLPKAHVQRIALARLSINECSRLRWLRYVRRMSHQEISKSEAALEGGLAIRLLQSLPWKDRSLIALREVCGFSLDQLAAIVDRPIEDIRKDLFRARQLLSTTARRRNR